MTTHTPSLASENSPPNLHELPPWARGIAALQAGRFNTEEALQQAVAQCLAKEGMIYKREAILSPEDRIDFAVEWDGLAVGIECKIRNGGMDVWRQLARYAPHFDALILVTTKPVEQNYGVEKPGAGPMPFHLLELWKNF